MLRRKVRDREDAVELLDALARSGLSRTEFCRDRGLDGRSLHCWERNLGRLAADATKEVSTLRLLEVTVASPRRSATYRVYVGDLVLELDDHFVDDTLARLVGVLSTC